MISVADKSRCCGCSACAAACPVDCITMAYDEEGCEYPQVDAEACVSCGACERACPVLNPVPQRARSQRAYVVQHGDAEVLLQSTSGGAMTAMAQAVLANGGIVFGAGYLRGPELERDAASPARLKVGHVGVEREEELGRFRNSKYVQSAMGPAFREVKRELAQGREVLFTGTPCQCEGLLRFLGEHPGNLLVADVVCHAVLSRTAFARYLDWLDARNEAPSKTVLFRDKHAYGYRYSSLCALGGPGIDQGKALYHAGVESDPFLRAFFSNICDRPSCYSCAFKKRYREADVTCWDCFNVHELCRELDDNRGATRVLAHSAAGNALVDRAQTYAQVEEIDVERAVDGVREMVASVPANPARAKFMADAVAMSGAELYEKWFPDTLRVKVERLARHTAERLGVYDVAKRIVKRLLGRR